jgi:hypothetical protein
MQEARKRILLYALQFDINDVHTYSGYKGGLVVRITTGSAEVVNAIEKFALSIPVLEVVVKNGPLMQFEIFCITEDEDVYSLKIK